MARGSGLTVSALRFYDGAGILVPEWVDPASGYRWYGSGQLAEARLLARLRRVGMPLADVRLVLASWSAADTALVRTLLDAHLLRLEDGLDDARRELSAVRALLALRETPVSHLTTDTTTRRLSLDSSALAAALDAVRFAVSTDPQLPMLAGVLFDADPEGQLLRLVATDRYRLATAQAPFQCPSEEAEHAAAQVLVPTPLVDAARAVLGGDGPVTVTLGDGRISVETADGQVAGPGADHDFPDYRRLTRLAADGRRRITVDVSALRTALATGPTRASRREQDGVDADVSVLSLAPDGTLTVEAADPGPEPRQDQVPADGRDRELIGVNREFLLEAMAVTARDQLILELGGPIAPLAIRLPEHEDVASLLMPVRLRD
ncbi:MerR family transcriptional regulator [Streptacidiphilus sp. EB129]|uniref:DNA polymerase III subunit beta family protein n=1 Tax=Streptacidiphilus sp. EB129 TaxID=3156262 RepID=UPI0035166811